MRLKAGTTEGFEYSGRVERSNYLIRDQDAAAGLHDLGCEFSGLGKYSRTDQDIIM
jgi:hypothetical protein